MKKFIVIFIVFNLCCSYTYAHGNLSIRIKEKTQEISKHPRKAVLYFERGYLYQQHYEYQKAINDYKKAEKLGHADNLLNFRKSKSYFESKKFKKALIALKPYYIKNPLDIKAHKLEAQILNKLKRYHESLSANEYVFNNTIDLRPNDVISYSESILLVDAKNYNKAIYIIELGLQKLGTNVIVLQLKKLELFKKGNQVENTIQLLNELIIKQHRKEYWYYKKAEYLFEIGDVIKSNIALQQSIISTKELSLKSQNTAALKKLLIDIHNLEEKINL
jgi:predicted Zn-dependent protease